MPTKWMRKHVMGLGLALLVPLLPLHVQADAIDTNRPGFSFTTGIVPEGQWQLETGVSYDRPNSNTDAWSLPLAELRYGINGRWETYLTSISWAEQDNGMQTSDGLVDMVMGVKARLSKPESTTQMSLVMQVNVPVGDDELTSDRWDPSAAFVWHHQGSFQIAGTVKISDYDNGYQVDNGLKLPISLGGPHSAFVEWEANLPEHGENTHWLNGGYQWLVRENMQFDINAGIGLTDETGDYRLGMGFSIRP